MYICIGNNNNKTKYSDYNTHIVYATNRLSQFYAPEFTHKISIGWHIWTEFRFDNVSLINEWIFNTCTHILLYSSSNQTEIFSWQFSAKGKNPLKK